MVFGCQYITCYNTLLTILIPLEMYDNITQVKQILTKQFLNYLNVFQILQIKLKAQSIRV